MVTIWLPSQNHGLRRKKQKKSENDKKKIMITFQPNQNCISITGRWDTGILWALKQPCRGYGCLLEAGLCFWYWDFIFQKLSHLLFYFVWAYVCERLNFYQINN